MPCILHQSDDVHHLTQKHSNLSRGKVSGTGRTTATRLPDARRGPPGGGIRAETALMLRSERDGCQGNVNLRNGVAAGAGRERAASGRQGRRAWQGSVRADRRWSSRGCAQELSGAMIPSRSNRWRS